MLFYTVHGVEYAFGAHEYGTTGIFEGEPKQCDGFTFRKALLIGFTELSSDEVRRVMEELAEEYKGNAYNLITKNCNHFCNDACIRLTRNPIPSWVNRLARIGKTIFSLSTSVFDDLAYQFLWVFSAGFFCNCIIPASINTTKINTHNSSKQEEKIREEDKLCDRSKRFTPSSTFSSSSASSSPLSDSASRTNRRKRSVTPTSPLMMDSPSSSTVTV